MRTLTSVKPISNHRLECLFNDGTKKIADIAPFLDKEAFKHWPTRMYLRQFSLMADTM